MWCRGSDVDREKWVVDVVLWRCDEVKWGCIRCCQGLCRMGEWRGGGGVDRGVAVGGGWGWERGGGRERVRVKGEKGWISIIRLDSGGVGGGEFGG